MQIVILILAILIPIIFIVFFTFKNTKYKTYCNNTFLLVTLFLLSFFIFFLSGLINHEDIGDLIFSPIFKAISMFALGNSVEDLNYTFQGYPWMYDTYKILIIYVDQLICLLSVSLVILTTFIKTLRAKMFNFGKSIKSLPYIFDLRNKKRCVKNVVYTDLPFDDIDYFLKKLKKIDGMVLKVVVLLSSTKTDRAEHLTDILKINGYDVSNEYLSVTSLRKMIFAPNGKVNVYSLFYRDEDNIEFAKIALKLCNSKAMKRKVSKQLLNFYVSYQDESYNSKLDFSKESNGCIQLVSEYDWAATKFVFYNPLTRILDLGTLKEDKYAFLKKIANPPQLHVHFFGFGNISRSLLNKMFPNYQLPYKDKKVIYHILDTEGKNLCSSYLSQFDAFNSFFKNKEEYLEQRSFADAFIGYDIDLNKEDQIRKYITDVILPSLKDNQQHMIIIALGASFTNLTLAMNIRRIIKNYSSAFNINLKDKSFKKSLIVYPYIKESNAFMANPLYYGSFINEIMSKRAKDTIPSTKEIVKILTDTNEHGYGERLFDYGKDYESSRLYVFDVQADDVTLKECFAKKEDYHLFQKTYKNLNPLNFFKHLRRAIYILETVPIVAFGRGGYLRDELSDHIRDLAAMENFSYTSKSKIQDIKDKNERKNIKLSDYQIALELWNNSLNHYQQMANIGSILSLPYKLGLFGYKFKMSENLKEIQNFSLHNQKVIDSINFSLRQPFNINNDIESKDSQLLLTKNDLKPIFSEKFLSTYQGEIITYNLLRKHFLKIYKDDYLEFKKNIVKFKETKKGDISLFTDLYALTFDLNRIINQSALIIRNIEHNRWYVLNAEEGIVPLTKEEILDGFKKSQDGLRHYCMTSNEGLNELARLIIRFKLSEKENDQNKGKVDELINFATLEELLRHIETSPSNVLKDIYKLVYYNDISSLTSLKDKLSVGNNQKVIYYFKNKGGIKL